MSSWRERLCGSIALGNAGEDEGHVLEQFINPNQTVSCGGGHYPVAQNIANMNTQNSSFLLPTKNYSVLIFKEDGSAVIYSDEEPNLITEEREEKELLEF